MSEFEKCDVLILAKAILEDCVKFNDSCDYRGVYCCEYCGSESFKFDDFKHDLDCPVLVATDIMTGQE